MPQAMRCFIAVELPEEAKNELRRLQQQIKNSRGSDLKASFTKDFHITLKFLGELTPPKAEEVKKKLGSCRFKKITTALDGLGVFPGESNIRVVWAGVKPEDEILKLQKDVDEALQADFGKEKDFKAHITLARVKHIGDKEGFLRMLKNTAVGKIKFEVSEFKLKRSVLGGSEGPAYEDLEAYGSQKPL